MPMNLNPEFQRVLRGYKVEEVDEFVNQISTAYEQVRRELFAAKEDNEKIKKQLEYFQALEGSLNKALVSAQQKADEIINTAQDEVNRSLVESRERLENINTEIAQILAGASEKSRQIEEEAQQRADQVLQRVREQVTAEAAKYNQAGHKIEEIKYGLIQALQGFLRELDTLGAGEFNALAESAASSETPEPEGAPQPVDEGQTGNTINW